MLPSNRGTVILALDMSGSMRARDLKPSRFGGKQEGGAAFIEKQPRRVRVGIVGFRRHRGPRPGADDGARRPVRRDRRLYPQRATAVGSAILVALNAIFEDAKNAVPGSVGPARRHGSAVHRSASRSSAALSRPAPGLRNGHAAAGAGCTWLLFFRSDRPAHRRADQHRTGSAGCRRPGRKAGREIFTVGIGTTRGDIVGAEGRSFRVALDEDTLKKIAQNTAGSYFKATDEGELLRIYQALSVRLTLGKDTTEITALFAGLALAVVLLGALLSQIWFNRL